MLYLANNPNDFHLFENFEVTKIVYQQEFKLIEKLQEIRNILVQRQEKIRRYVYRVIFYWLVCYRC
jgi:uncharacterized protein YutE (UPF0331/DUF86 family)